MDSVIVGLDETKSVLNYLLKIKAIADAIIHELGLGLTIMYGVADFPGMKEKFFMSSAERLQLAELKDFILREDPALLLPLKTCMKWPMASLQVKRR